MKVRTVWPDDILSVALIVAVLLNGISRASGQSGNEAMSPGTDLEEFPEGFLFGVSSSAYQIEGGWNATDKGMSIWDVFVHKPRQTIVDHSTGDVACDSYHKYKEDIELIESIGGTIYRVSFSWTRILPDGLPNRVSSSGLQYYDDLIDEILRKNITPMVTIFHWDLPQRLQDLGGWTNPLVVGWLEEYARVVFAHFGNRVKLWSTVNEPNTFCLVGYGLSLFPPAISQLGVADYLCAHHVLLAHARIYELYNLEFRETQRGEIGLILNTIWFVPQNKSSRADIDAATRAYQWWVGWFAHPLLSVTGDYPEVMKERIAMRSAHEGYPYSRLPTFTPEEIQRVRSSLDFFGVNFYNAMKVVGQEECLDPGYQLVKADWPGNDITQNTPWAFAEILHFMKREYVLPKLYITENGFGDYGGLRDVNRTIYHHDHIQALLSCMKSGIDVRGYMIWSLLDDFEWDNGYVFKFGLFQVDFNDTARPRTPKLSSKYITQLYTSGKIPKLIDYVNASSLSIF